MKRIFTILLATIAITSTSFAQNGEDKEILKAEKEAEKEIQKAEKELLKAQKKAEKERDQKKEENVIVEYTDVKLILDNQQELKLTSEQAIAFNIKNEYIKRDLFTINSNKIMHPIEKEARVRKLFVSYENFINRTLNKEQIDQWAIIKKNNTVKEEEKDLKTVLRDLNHEYKIETKRIYEQYKYDRKIYYAQRNIAKKAYETKKRDLIEEYRNKENGIVDEENRILTLEEIANLYKDYDEYYDKQNNTNALDYLDIKEEQYDEYGNLINPEPINEELYDEYGNLINKEPINEELYDEYGNLINPEPINEELYDEYGNLKKK